MSAEPFADVDRETLRDSSGHPVLRFLRTTRDGLLAADLVVSAEGVSDEEVAAAALETFPGWAFSGSVPVGRLLLDRGATTIRHAHVMTRALGDEQVEPAWADDLLPAGLALSVPPTDPRAYLELMEAAYPPEHTDHVPRTEDDRIAHDVLPLLDGTLGPLLDASAVLIERPAAGGPSAQARMVAACLVTDMDTNGPWVVDVARLPGPSYSGLGTLLLRRAVAVLREEGRPALGLAVTDGNPARRTYQRLGFVDVLESLTVKVPPG